MNVKSLNQVSMFSFICVLHLQISSFFQYEFFSFYSYFCVHLKSSRGHRLTPTKVTSTTVCLGLKMKISVLETAPQKIKISDVLCSKLAHYDL